MGVDGINGPGGSGIPEPPGQDRAAPGEFSVTGSSGTAASSVASSSVASSELERVASGELSVEQYLDERVERATSHLVGALPAEQLEDLKEVLREQLATDPVLVRLVSRVLGTEASEPGR